MNWNTLLSTKRFGLEHRHNKENRNRTEFQRDYDRLIFSAPFRRLQNKTQVFPLPGSVFVHNRLTHSLEVSSVGRSLGNNVSQILSDRIQNPPVLFTEIGSIVSAACLAHDLGNPPFGHSGEQAISTYFSEGNGKILESQLSEKQWNDLIHFEGNANAFRLLTHQFKGRREGGFAMTYSTLASIVKYPYESALSENKSKFGFFESEVVSYGKIAQDLGIIKLNDNPAEYVRYPLVYLVEAADDICYQIMDIEDAHKLRILSTEETKELFFGYLNEKQRERARNVLNAVTDINEQIAYLRSTIVGILITDCTNIFCDYEEAILSGKFKGSLMDYLPNPQAKAFKKSKGIAGNRIYRSKEVLDIELAGYKVITTLLDLFVEAAISPHKTYSKLLIDRVSSQYEIKSEHLSVRIQAVLDFISGMTDIYALDLYRKINGHSLPAI